MHSLSAEICMVQGLDCKLIPSPRLTLICNHKANERKSEKVDSSPNDLDR